MTPEQEPSLQRSPCSSSAARVVRPACTALSRHKESLQVYAWGQLVGVSTHLSRTSINRPGCGSAGCRRPPPDRAGNLLVLREASGGSHTAQEQQGKIFLLGPCSPSEQRHAVRSDLTIQGIRAAQRADAALGPFGRAGWHREAAACSHVLPEGCPRRGALRERRTAGSGQESSPRVSSKAWLFPRQYKKLRKVLLCYGDRPAPTGVCVHIYI